MYVREYLRTCSCMFVGLPLRMYVCLLVCLNVCVVVCWFVCFLLVFWSVSLYVCTVCMHACIYVCVGVCVYVSSFTLPEPCMPRAHKALTRSSGQSSLPAEVARMKSQPLFDKLGFCRVRFSKGFRVSG